MTARTTRATPEFIEGQIDVHDRTGFEVKTDYTIDPSRRASTYRVESYLFIPSTLGVNERTYSRDHFYRDIKAYIRFKTPTISLTALARGEAELLTGLVETAQRLPNTTADASVELEFIDSLKLLGCIVRSDVLHQLAVIKKRLKTQTNNGTRQALAEGDLAGRCDHFLTDLEAVVRAFRGLRAPLRHPEVSTRAFAAFQWVDEYVSLVLEERLTELLMALDQTPKAGESLKRLRARVKGLVDTEQSHRQEAGYQAVLTGADHGNEQFLYRAGVLKKFVMSVLWLEVDKERKGQGWADFFAAIAAGLAMAFAVAATILQSRMMAINTWSFLLPAVLVYILKDRIKDWVKLFFSQKMTRWVPDFNIRIRDPHSGETVGRCLEAVSYLARDRVPRDVLDMRHIGSHTDLWLKPEVVLKYEKSIRLRDRGLISKLTDTDCEIHDIVRFDISHLLGRADDPQSALPFYESQSDQVITRMLPKVYHLNVVLVLTAEDQRQQRSMSRIRVVLNKDGIKRIEELARG